MVVNNLVSVFLLVTVLLVVFWVDQVENGFEIPEEYKQRIEKCSGTPVVK